MDFFALNTAFFMFIKLYDNNLDPRQIKKIVDILKNGGVIIYPTDTVYGIGCDITNQKAVERIATIKSIKIEKANFSFICSDISQLSEYTMPINNYVFKVLKQNLPGAFTFILNANGKVPKLFKNNKKTVGIRIPDNEIILQLVRELGNPILTTSIYNSADLNGYITDPELIYEEYYEKVDVVIDGGIGGCISSTIIDCTKDNFEILREGKGKLV